MLSLNILYLQQQQERKREEREKKKGKRGKRERNKMNDDRIALPYNLTESKDVNARSCVKPCFERECVCVFGALCYELQFMRYIWALSLLLLLLMILSLFTSCLFLYCFKRKKNKHL